MKNYIRKKFYVPENWTPGRGISEDVWFKKNQRILLWMANTDYGRDLFCIPKHYGRIVRFTKCSVTAIEDFREGRIIKRSDFRVGAKWANIIRYRFNEFLKYSAYYEKDWKVGLRHFLFQPVFVPGLTITTVYPDPNPESTTVDGRVGRSGGDNNTWATIRSQLGNVADDSGAISDAWTLQAGTNNGTYSDLNFRGIYLFDITAIPDTDTITAATVSFVISSMTTALGGTGSTNSAMVFTSSNPASNTALVNADHQAMETTTEYGRSGSQSTLTADNATYNDITINATGITALQTAQSGSNIYKGGIRSGWDQDNLAPFSNGATWGAGNPDSALQVRSADNAGTSQDPKLAVTHSAATTAIALHTLLLMNIG